MAVTLGARAEHGFDEPIGLLSDCHRRIERFLGALSKVCSNLHGGPLDDAHRQALRQSVDYFKNAAPRHTEDEEVSLFPRLRSLDDPALQTVLRDVDRLEDQHRAADIGHQRVNELAERWLADGRLSQADARELESELARLEALYREHITLEETQVFPRAAEALSKQQIAQVGQEMAARRGLTFRPGE